MWLAPLAMLAAAAVLRFTLPQWDAWPLVCAAGPQPCADLAWVRLHGQPRGGLEQVLAEHPAGAAGALDSFVVDLPDVWTLWVTTLDGSGNESCPSNPVGVGLTASVPPSCPVVAQWYDLQGRRIQGTPRRAGVYWRRAAGRPAQLAIIR